MAGLFWYCGVVFLVSHVSAQNFSLYPPIDPTSLSKAFNISADCLDALNATLPCDPTLLQMATNVDNYWWEADNLTSLCTLDCFYAVESWDADVENRCYYDTLVAYNKIVPASSVSGRYSDGFHIACLTSGNATDTSDGISYCLTDSQEWVGNDFVKPDCTINPTAPFCSDPTNLDAESQRIANLYGNDVLCSECFIQMMRLRLISPYLPDHDFSDYLIGEYLDILDICNYTNQVPELIIRAPPSYATAVPPSLNLTGAHNDTSSCPSPNQLIVTKSLSPGATCNSISQAFNASTGDIQAAIGNTNCTTTSKPSFCLPPACTLKQVPPNTTCDILATSFSTPNLTVTSIQLLNWNPNINGLCDSLRPGEYICASAPGGSYIPPPPPPGSASDGGQQRGGGDGSTVNVTSPTTTVLPSPIQNGTVADCRLYAQAQAADGCETFTQEFNISLEQLVAWNPVLGVGGANCRTLFWGGEWYCVSGADIPSPSTTYSSSATSSKSVSSSTASGPPSPIQTGVTEKCNKYAKATSSDLCWSFAQENGITTEQLYAWNTVLGSGGSNCNMLFWAGEYYCVGIST